MTRNARSSNRGGHSGAAHIRRRTQREYADLRMFRREQEGFGLTNSYRGDMHGLGFKVVKRNRDDAIQIATEVHDEPPDDETIALFTDASLPGAQGDRFIGGVAVVRVSPRDTDQSATAGSSGQEVPGQASKPYSLDVVTGEEVTVLDRPSDCPMPPSRQLEVQEVELLAILKGFEYAVVEAEARSLGDLTTSRLLLWSDCFGGLDQVRLYRAGGSAWQRHPFAWILRQILECARKLKELGVYVKCQWVPGHELVPGNEAADYVAGQVASGRTWDPARVARF